MGEECCGDKAVKEDKPQAVQVKADYVGSMESKFAEIGAKLDELHSKASDAKEQAAHKYEEVKKHKEEFAKRLAEIKDSTGDAWTEFKGGLEKALDELKLAAYEVKEGSTKAVAKFEK
jgi:hypothetical protein